MKNLSIKLQLTIWYSVTIFIVSAVLFTSFYYITKRAVSKETDRSLLNHATQIADNIALNTNNIFDSQTQEILDVSKSQIPGIFITATDVAGHGVKSEDDGTFLKLAKDAIENKKEAYVYQTLNGVTLRLISFPIQRSGNIIGTIVMGHPVDIYQQALRELRGIATLIILFLILPSILLGYLLASSAANFINNLAKRMRRITTENLSERAELPSKSSETFNLVTSFNNLLDRINESFNREKQFIGEVAHEIKTPLAVIKNGAEVALSKEREVVDYKTALEQVLRHVDKLATRLSGLIDFTWSQAYDVKRHFAVVNISNILKEVCESAKLLAFGKNISTECKIAENLFVFGKADKLSQVFYNIVDNAIKYTQDGGKIALSLEKENTKAVVRISDTGVGISEDELKTIFDRFYRSENHKNIKGHGLGLAIANSIVKAHNGEISVKSNESKGTTFIVSIPLSS